MSVADDGKILAKLPKVKVLRNNQREGGLHLSLLRINLQLIYRDRCLYYRETDYMYMYSCFFETKYLYPL